ncbi:recombinase family protein [Brevundimonas sp. NPDC058933]|uniref:recombinase family protein n=1 Tax=Brevundimonas sp. NPDC058933 TaxID=3346673 RepID=UPI003BEEC1C3
MTVKAYSYLRFSSAAQREGDSLRRQLQAAKDWAATRPDVELDTTTRDLGVSAYKGEHRVRGALSSFLKRIEQGDIAPGSYLLVESFDRLSRETEMVAVNLLTSITLAGIRVVTLTDGHEYHAGSDAMDIMRAVIVMSRAHNENKARAQKLREAWADKKKRARETGEVLSRRGPAWTKFDDRTKRFKLIGERAEIVRRIFEECNEGLGITAIASRLNADKVAPFVKGSDGWHQGYVLTILRSPSVCGYYQPTLTTNRPGQRMGREADGDVIEDYYPRVIEDATFYKAQDMIARRNKRGGGKGRRGKTFANLLIGLGRCESCGGTLILGSRANSSAVRHFRCYHQSRKHRCDNATRYLATEVEERLMFFLMRARMNENQSAPDAAALTVKLAQIDDVKRRMETLLDQLEERVPGVAERLKERRVELTALEQEAADLRMSIERRTKTRGDEAIRNTIEWLKVVEGEAPDAEVYMARAKANAMLNDLLDFVMPADGGIYIGMGDKFRWIGEDMMTFDLPMPEAETITGKELAEYRGPLEFAA